MKRICVILMMGILLLFNHYIAYSQNLVPFPETSIIEPLPLTITFHKTTSLVFPFAIQSVDRGSRDILVQKAKGADHVLLLKAGRPNFSPSNVTVITTEGKLYCFVVDYSPIPPLLSLQLGSTPAGRPGVHLFSAMNKTDMARKAAKLAGEKRRVRGLKDQQYGIKLQLRGVHIDSGVLYYTLRLQNKSNIPFEADQWHFFIRDRKTFKQTATQEQEIFPLYVYGNTQVIKSDSQNIIVFALPKFTPAAHKYLALQLSEINGGRQLQLKVHYRTLLKARPVAE